MARRADRPAAARAGARPLGRSRAPSHTLRSLLDFATERFTAAGLAFGHGTDNARDEAAYLILHALGLPLDRLEPDLDTPLRKAQADAALAIIRRRVVTRMPAAYLTHEAWLGDLAFYVDRRVIVPRSYIAELLRERLRPWVRNPRRIGTLLDLCCGSACLAISAALAFPNCRIDAVDISRDALAVARRNVERYALQDRVDLIRSDLFERLGARRYDLIIANPPYVTAAQMRRLPAEYRHEPHAALAAGRDGLDLVRRILAGAPHHLARGGTLVMEVGHKRARVEHAFPRLPFTWLETSGGDDCVLLLGREQFA